LVYLIKVDRETGNYFARSSEYPDLETSSDSFYRAVEKLEDCIRERELTKVSNESETQPTANEIPPSPVEVRAAGIRL
jgi:hypothetical protein